MQIHQDDTEMTELDWFIVEMLCKEIIGPHHIVERPLHYPSEDNKKATADTVAHK